MLPKSENGGVAPKAASGIDRARAEYRDATEYFMQELTAEQAKKPDRFVIKLGELGGRRRAGS